MKITHAFWFTEFMANWPIGIVIGVDDQGTRKAYIGTGLGRTEKFDSEEIAKYGTKIQIRQLEEILKALKGS